MAADACYNSTVGAKTGRMLDFLAANLAPDSMRDLISRKKAEKVIE